MKIERLSSAEQKKETTKLPLLGSEALLLLTALIWGLAFVAQREGMRYLDPFMFTGLRFSLGALTVGVFALNSNKRKKRLPFPWPLGLVLFLAVSLQQIGLVYTTAGNAGFITGLYVVIVPVLGLLRKQRLTKTIIIAALTALAGLALINLKQAPAASLGNLLVLICAFFWAVHMHLVDHYAKRYDTFQLAFYQYAFCAGAGLICGIGFNLIKSPDFLWQSQTYASIGKAALPLLYSGILSVGVAFTLQVAGQKKVPPAPATVILSLESVFALVGGWIILGEKLTVWTCLGAGLIFAAMLISTLRAATEQG